MPAGLRDARRHDIDFRGQRSQGHRDHLGDAAAVGSPNPYPGAFYAFDAESLDFLWATRYGTISHWVPPTVAAGKVFLAEGDAFQFLSWRLAVYELGRGASDRTTVPIVPDDPAKCNNCH